MIELRVLGTLDLRDADGRVLHAVLSAPKRFALLVYLAVGRSPGFHSRDELLAVFWPDHDIPHARATLRQTVRLLRQALGPDTIESRGGEIGLNPDKVRCDAVEFDRLREASRLREAVELYRGPLLEGFHYAHAGTGFEEWREQEGARLRDGAVRALRSLAEAAERSEDSAAAELWYRRLLRIAPYDEAALRGLMEALARDGNRARAVREFETFERRLTRGLELTSSAETLALVEGLRAQPTDEAIAAARPDRPGPGAVRADATLAPPVVGHVREDSPTADGAPPPPAGPPGGRPRSPHRYLRPRLPAVALLVILVAACGWAGWLAFRPESGSPFVERVAVLPFSYRGSDHLAYLGPGIAELLAVALDGSGLGAATAAEPTDPTLLVTGDLVEVDGTLHATAELHDPVRGASAVTRATVRGAADDVFRMVDDLAAALLTRRPGAPGGRFSSIAGITTASLPALKEYLGGEEHLGAGRYDAAIAAFERAITRDSAFALAHYRLGVAAEWAPRPDLMSVATEAAVRHSDRLPPRERQLLQASLAWRRGAVDDPEARYREFLRMYPDDPEGWFQLGEVLFHLNPLRGRRIGESREAWERVIAADPQHLPALLHLARVLAAQADAPQLDRHVPAVPPVDTERDRRVLQMAGLRAVAHGDERAAKRLGRLIVRASDTYWVDLWYIAAFARDLRGALGVLEPLVEEEQPAALRAIGHAMRAHVELGRGRWRSARVELSAAGVVDPALALPYHALLGVLPFAPSTRAELAEIRTALLQWDPDTVPPSPDPRPAFTVHARVYPQLRTYLLGALAARQGYLLEAARRTAELREMGGSERARELAVDLAGGLDALVAAREERWEDALRALEGVRIRTTFDQAFLSPFHARALERHLRAEALYQLGRDAEALRWFDAAAQVSPYELVYLAISHLRRGQIHDRLGDGPRARHHYARFLELWDRPDPELGHLTRRTRARLKELDG
ncbi:MAG: tetratricopeptide repeat protein [Gemmatimonadetes bacterium]|nr:tetratricopeptide repeat protein [Gemmatimonadota bacterium]